MVFVTARAAAPVLSIQAAATTYATVFDFSDSSDTTNFVRCNSSCVGIDHCVLAGHDFPDNPPRPFLGPDGNVWLWASNSQALATSISGGYGSYIKEANADLSGPASGVNQCKVGFQYTPVTPVNDGSNEQQSLASLNNQHWLLEFWAQGIGRSFQAMAMIQNDFHGQSLPDCAGYASLTYCRYTNLIAGTWSNQQQQFTVPITQVSDDGIVDDYMTSPLFVTPSQYQAKHGEQGVNAQTNIVYAKNPGDRIPYYYVLINEATPSTLPGGSAISGICLFRTNNVNDSNSWLGWNAVTKTFSVKFNANPYTTTISNPTICSFVLPSTYRFSLAYSPQYKTFIAIGDQGSASDASNNEVVYATTQDLTDWGPSNAPTNTGVMLTHSGAPSFTLEQYWVQTGGVNVTGEGYLSLIDPTSSSISRTYFGQPDSNFQYVSNNPYLYLVRFNPVVSGLGGDTERDVVRVPLAITCTANCSVS